MLMDTRQLAAFCAVVEKKSFSQAAERLGVTQPAVSLQIDALEEGETIVGRFELGASTGPGGSVVPIVLAELARAHPDLSIALTVADTQRIVDLVADRALELGVVGFARRHRSVVFEPLFRDEVVLALPPDHPFAGRTVSLDELRPETLILMQEGAGVREAIEDEFRHVGIRLRDFDVRLELG